MELSLVVIMAEVAVVRNEVDDVDQSTYMYLLK